MKKQRKPSNHLGEGHHVHVQVGVQGYFAHNKEITTPLGPYSSHMLEPYGGRRGGGGGLL